MWWMPTEAAAEMLKLKLPQGPAAASFRKSENIKNFLTDQEGNGIMSLVMMLRRQLDLYGPLAQLVRASGS